MGKTAAIPRRAIRERGEPDGFVDEEVLTAQAVADRLGLTRGTIMDYLRKGFIHASISDRKSPRFDWAEVKRDLRKLNK